MASKFGGIPVEQPKQSRFGGVPVEQELTQENVSFGEFIEPIATVGSAMVAEPLAGLAGIAQSINPFASPGAGARAVEATREALTYQPRTEGGQRVVSELGETLAPVGEVMQKAERSIGDTVYDATGSAALAAGAASLPTAALEVLGMAGGKGVLKTGRGALDVKKSISDFPVDRALSQAAPEISQLKDASRALFNEIKQTGTIVKKRPVEDLARRVVRVADKMAARKKTTPEVFAVIDEVKKLRGSDAPLENIEILREVAQGVASSLNPKTASIGVQMIEEIDDFLDGLGPDGFKVAEGTDLSGLGKKYSQARGLWGRARKSEVLQEAFDKAGRQASGFENGIRTQFRSILNNKRKSRFFSDPERALMDKVVKGGKGENLARLLGKFGFNEGSATSMLGGSIGVAGGAAVGGAPGAVAVPLVGQLSRKLAQRMTANNARFADAVVRAGKNGRKIVEAYMKNTPRGKRSSAELSELLMSEDIDLSSLPKGPIVDKAKQLRNERIAQLTGATAAGAVTGLQENR